MKEIQIILPAILCVLIINITKMSIWFYPFSFGLVIGLVNWKAHKYNPYIGTLLSVIVSLISFWLAVLCIGVFGNFRDFVLQNTNLIIGESIKMYDVFIPSFIIAPILVFLLYRFVFNISKTKFSLYIIICSIILLILDFVFFWKYSEKSNYYRMLPYIIWQFIMASALQIIITKNNTLNKSNVIKYKDE